MKYAYAGIGALLVILGAVYVMYQDVSTAPDQQAFSSDTNQAHTMSLTLTSPAFQDNAMIPEQYTCDGENINPPLQISGVPEDASSLILVMDDPDIPNEVQAQMGIEAFDHWVLYGIPADTIEIPEQAQLGTPGKNSTGDDGYTGPCPPTQYEPTEHRYVFRLYAVDAPLSFDTTPTLAEVEAMAEERMIEKVELVGRYERPQG